MESPRTRDDRIAAVASLDQPLRRQLHELLAVRDGWTDRDEAATALGVARSVAAFHLDKLADAGVVEVTFERTTGRAGPGAGRPSKMYRLAATEVSASMPERHYHLAGQLLADAVADSMANGTPIDQCLRQVARATGRAMGIEDRTDPDGGVRAVASDVGAALERHGYEPCVLDEGEIALSNCPFHRLAEDHRSLVCGMNLDLLTGLVEGLNPDPALHARLAPVPGYCCVRLSHP
jgi:predicted ArsR family transcriptional regulator